MIRAELEGLAASKGAQWLYEELLKQDPDSAAKIDPHNVRRTIRALEVIRLTGRKFSLQRRQVGSSYRVLTVGLTRPRPELYTRVDARIEAMFTAGLLNEVQRLLDHGVSPGLPSMTSIGYRECIAVIQGRMTIEQAKVQMRRLTRVFVRRQANWFKLADPSMHWFEAGKLPVEGIIPLIREFLQAEGCQKT
jgi:tRNA dimethylallyltransferase